MNNYQSLRNQVLFNPPSNGLKTLKLHIALAKYHVKYWSSLADSFSSDPTFHPIFINNLFTAIHRLKYLEKQASLYLA